jgi:manganese transport protein
LSTAESDTPRTRHLQRVRETQGSRAGKISGRVKQVDLTDPGPHNIHVANDQSRGLPEADHANAQAVLSGSSQRGFWARLTPFLGPAFIASVAYIDPGNFATNIQAGARNGYTLLWVVVCSNLMAMLIQALSAKLGIATGMNLAELCRERFSRPVTLFLWMVMELVAMATDLAEFLGAAIAFNLLFGMPLLGAAVLTALLTFLMLSLDRYGSRPLETVVSAMVGIVACCYLIETFLDRPQWDQVFRHAVTPSFANADGVLLAAGILGATVMPHAIFLHSALTQGRIVTRDRNRMRRLFHYEIVDVLVAMGLAGAINAAMLIMAAATFHERGLTSTATIEQSYRTLQPLLGAAAGAVFAISLLAAGLSSSVVGTMAGQIIMQGFLRRQIPVWVRRLLTILPSIGVIAAGLDPTRSMVMSQVILSFGLPFAILPLISFTSNRTIMGPLTNRKLTTVLACLCALLIVSLNFYLIYEVFSQG